MPAIIEVDHLTFHYPGVCALDDVSFRIEPGTVTALVGPNGAGKTTLLGCLAALERPLAGQITLDGISVIDQPRQSHTLIGYLPDFYGLYEDLSVEQCLRYMAMAQGIPEHKLSGAVTVAAERVQLAEEILATLHEADDEVDAAWDAEIQRRVAEIENGTAELISAEEAFARLRRLPK